MQAQLIEEYSGSGYHIYQFKTGELSALSYLVESAGNALLIDPIIDGSAYTAQLKKTGAELKYVLLTHFHADIILGHLEYKVPVVMGQGSKVPQVSFPVEEFKDGAVLNLGDVKITVLSTPGPSLQSACFLLTDKEGKNQVLFTGDTLLIGEVGRTDLAATSEHSLQELAALLYDSIQKVKTLDAHLRILPAHGSGSSCGKAIGDGNSCTLEKQIANNYALKINSKEEFVNAVTKGIAKPPVCFSHNITLNKSGPVSYSDLLKQSTTPLSIEQFKELIAKGHPVIDTRSSAESLKEGYIKGSYLVGDSGYLSIWVGSLLDPRKQLLIVTEKNKADDNVARLVRVGYKALGVNNFTIKDWVAQGGQISIPKFSTIAEMKEVPAKLVLDVRTEGEAQSGHVEGSLNIPLAQLAQHIQKVPKENPIYVHCRVGYRAKIGASILAQHGIESLILPVKFEEFGQAGVPIVK